MYSAMGLRPALGDRLLAGLVVIAVAAEAAMGSHLPWLLAVVFGSALAAASLMRRTVPLLATALAFGTFLVVDLILAVLDAEPVTVYSGVFVLPIAYSLVRWGSGRDIAVGSSIVAAEFLVSISTDFTGLQDALGGAAVLLLAGAIGVIFRYRAQARHQLVEQARLQERENLARERMTPSHTMYPRSQSRLRPGCFSARSHPWLAPSKRWRSSIEKPPKHWSRCA
jgi:hypothetical protein